jgi:hypothetical protein
MPPVRTIDRTASCPYLLLAVLAVACGGNPKPADNPEPATSAAAAPVDSAPAPSSATADVSAPSAASSAASSAATTAPPAPPAPAITVVALKIAANKVTKGKAVEVKADGTVLVDGKPVAKFSGAELQDSSGKTILAVASDGTVSGPSVNRQVKFSSTDDLVNDDGSKISIADDGSVTRTTAAGKADKAPFKIRGVTAASRREAILVAGWMMM